MSGGNVELYDLMNQPFHYQEYKVNYEGFVSIGPQSVADRLNIVLGIYDWSHDIVEFKEDHDEFTVSVRGVLKIRDPKSSDWVTRTQFGDKKVVMKESDAKPKPQAFLDAKKSAVSDSLKKCAAWFGVASDVYKGKIKSVTAKMGAPGRRDENPMYLALKEYFSLDPYDSHFEHGIVILPDEYRSYYLNKGWWGIFESDKKEAWLRFKEKYSLGSGHGSQQQNQSSQSSGNQPRRQHQNSTNSQTNQTTSTAPVRNPNPSSQQRNSSQPTSNNATENMLYEFVGLRAEEHPVTRQPLFRIEFKHQGESVVIWAVDDNVMKFIDKNNLKEGTKYKVKTMKSEKGKLILKHINKAS